MTPHFFKIILDDTIRDGKLGIPRRFVRKYGNDLPNPVLLKVPSGALWKVELTKCDGDVWLHNGWQEFAEYYSLSHGHFLVFRYEENSQFSVVIFDMSASEIEYPYTITHDEESSDSDGELQGLKIDETEDDISVEVLDDILRCPKRREKSPLSYPQPHKLMRTNSTNKTEGTSQGKEVEDFKRNIDSNCSIQEVGGLNSPATKGGEGKSTGWRGSQSIILGRMLPLTASERASAFKSDNPFFMVTIQPSYFQYGSRPSIPAAFARKYLIMKQGDAILCISDCRTWSVKYQRVASNCNPHAKLSNGWRAFAQDNHLEVGDVCVFELMKGTEISFKVVIFRLVEDANCHLSPGNLKQLIHTGRQCTQRSSRSRIPVALEAARKFISENPFFVRSANLGHCNLNVPFMFVEKLIKQIGEQNITLQVADRSWPVKLVSYPHHKQASLCQGWTAFSRDNSLCLGDVCVFELIKRDDAVLKVFIFRGAD